MRFVVCLLVASLCSVASAQDQNFWFAWNSCQQARAACLPVKVTGDDAAATAYGKAKAAVAGLPSEYKASFQRTLDDIGRGLEDASGDHSAGEGTESIANGRYKTLSARVAQGNFFGAADEARHIAELYRYATYKKNSANQGYGNVKDRSDNLVREIEQFLAMLEGFKDFYGDYP